MGKGDKSEERMKSRKRGDHGGVRHLEVGHIAYWGGRRVRVWLFAN